MKLNHSALPHFICARSFPTYLRRRSTQRKCRLLYRASRRRKTGTHFSGSCALSFAHDLFRKPVPTFRDHALCGRRDLGLEPAEHPARVAFEDFFPPGVVEPRRLVDITLGVVEKMPR